MLIVLLIGAVTSFFGKPKAQQGKGTSTEPVKTFPPSDYERPVHHKKETNERPHINPFEQLKREFEEKVKESSRKLEDMLEPKKKEKTLKPMDLNEAYLAKLDEMDNEYDESHTGRKEQLEKEMEQLSKSLQKNHSNSKQIAVSSVNHSTVVEGIIWSEILGPPRAKRPYRPNTFQK